MPKPMIAKVAHKVESWVDGFRKAKRVPAWIDPYVGYATQTQLIVRGRVMGRSSPKAAIDGQSRWRNFYQMLRLFLTYEVAGVPVHSGEIESISDEEGYFTLTLPRDGQVGLIEVSVQTEQGITANCPVVVPRDGAARGIISDIDDTMIATGAYSLWRNIFTSMTGNALTRIVFDDAARLLTVLGGPVFFVSSSPWNLHGFLDDVFERAGLPVAPKFLRDYGISPTQFITGTHGDHKGAAIDAILGAQPDLPFVLIGDTGQHDAEVYLDAIKRHPNRVEHVILRHAGKVDDLDRNHMAAIVKTGVPVTVGADYAEAIAHFS